MPTLWDSRTRGNAMKNSCTECGAPMHPVETSLEPSRTAGTPIGPSFDSVCTNHECGESVEAVVAPA